MTKPPRLGRPTLSASAPPPWAVEMENLSVKLDQFTVFSQLSLKIPEGRQTAIIGPNGAGKSTLMLTLLGQLPHGGRVAFSPARPRLGYVPQRLNFDRRLPLTTLEYLALYLTNRPLWLGRSRQMRLRALSLLRQVQAESLIDRPLGALSGGELQRVLLAAALSLEPHLLILDEPTTGVDVYGEALLCELLDDMKGRFTIIMVSHDLPTAETHADWVVCLNRGLVAQGPPAMIFTPEVMAATFGAFLL